MLAFDWKVDPASRLTELAPLEAVEPGVEHLEPIARDNLVTDDGRAALSFEERREAPPWALLEERCEALLAGAAVSIQRCGSSTAMAALRGAGMAGKVPSRDPDVALAWEGGASTDELEWPKEKDRRVRWKRFTALRKASSKPLLFEEGST